MSVGAICFTSSGSKGGCWVVLVFPRLFFFFFLKKGFFSHTRLTPKKKSLRDLHQKKISVKKNATYAQKKNKKRLALISTIELRFPRIS